MKTITQNGAHTRKKQQKFSAIPRGWYQLAEVGDISPGELQTIACFDQELILYQTKSGEIQVCEPWCPHLGAHLGHGGSVVGEEIRCPFHGWQFNTEGGCSHIPYAGKIPPKAKLNFLPMEVVDGRIMVYFDANGNTPTFPCPRIEEEEQEGWSELFLLKETVKAPIKEILEGGVDAAHLAFVHGAVGHPVCTFLSDGQRAEAHTLAHYTDYQNPNNKKGAPAHTRLTLEGPGFAQTKIEAAMIESRSYAFLLPVTPRHTELFLYLQIKNHPNPRYTQKIWEIYMKNFQEDFDRDKQIWETKTWHDRPSLCDGDGPIMAFRRWMSQFNQDKNDKA